MEAGSAAVEQDVNRGVSEASMSSFEDEVEGGRYLFPDKTAETQRLFIKEFLLK